jgi:hypothetical protein
MGFNILNDTESLYKIRGSKENDMKLSGTSTLHKWTMDSKSFLGDADFEFVGGSNYKLSSINALSFSLPVMSLKSGENGLDKNAYKALKSDKYKTIGYTLTSSTLTLQKGESYLAKTQGKLSIAGVTRPITMDVLCTVNKDETINCSGSYTLKMTDYQVKPPTFFLGAMKTGDAVTLDFTLVYKK